MYFLKLIFPYKFHSLLNNNLVALLGLSVIVKLFIMTFSIHPDFFFIYMFPNLLVSHQITNIYQLFGTELASRLGFYYSPPVFYFFSLIQFLFTPFTAGFGGYMDNAYNLYKIGLGTPLGYLNSTNINYFKIFLILKSPYILFDFGVLIILLRLVDRSKMAKKSFLFWIFNPIVLYGTYAYGQFDIIPTFLLILGLYLGLKKKIILAMLTIGLASTFKNFSLLAILPAALCFGKNFRDRTKLSLIGFSPFIVSFLIVLFQAPSEAVYTILPKFFVVKNTTDSSIYSIVSKGARYLLLGIIYILILAFSIFGKINLKEKVFGLVAISLISLFAFSPVILFHYLTIVTPFLIIFFANRRNFFKLFTLYVASAGLFKLWTPLQQIGLFAPLNNGLYFFPSTSELISKVFPYSYLSSFAYVVFFGLSIYFIVIITRNLIFQAETK